MAQPLLDEDNLRRRRLVVEPRLHGRCTGDKIDLDVDAMPLASFYPAGDMRIPGFPPRYPHPALLELLKLFRASLVLPLLNRVL
jgi:hypothetical protein